MPSQLRRWRFPRSGGLLTSNIACNNNIHHLVNHKVCSRFSQFSFSFVLSTPYFLPLLAHYPPKRVLQKVQESKQTMDSKASMTLERKLCDRLCRLKDLKKGQEQGESSSVLLTRGGGSSSHGRIPEKAPLYSSRPLLDRQTPFPELQPWEFLLPTLGTPQADPHQNTAPQDREPERERQRRCVRIPLLRRAMRLSWQD